LFDVDFEEHVLTVHFPLPKVPTIASMLEVFTFYACEFSLHDETQCISFNNLTPEGFFLLDNTLESLETSLSPVRGDGSFYLTFNQAMDFQRLSRFKLHKLKVILNANIDEFVPVL